MSVVEFGDVGGVDCKKEVGSEMMHSKERRDGEQYPGGFAEPRAHCNWNIIIRSMVAKSSGVEEERRG